MRLTLILPFALAGALAAPAMAQNTGSLTEIDNTNVVSPDGTNIGEVEGVLIDDSGAVAAVAVELKDGFLSMGGDQEVIFSLDQLSFQNGNYTTDMTSDEIKGLPTRND
ncbi:MAG TPA: PRC-barrel domain-containing protein [Paracoccaceae bacterium]|nr:PRC-barrel domain-containing protein [Paracoccaceae bacterium]